MAEQHFLYSGLTDRIVQIVQGRARQVSRIYRVGMNIARTAVVLHTHLGCPLGVAEPWEDHVVFMG